MTKAPFRSGEGRLSRVSYRDRGESGEMIDADEHMKKPGGETGDNRNQVSWFSPGTGVRINHTELAMPRASVIAM